MRKIEVTGSLHCLQQIFLSSRRWCQCHSVIHVMQWAAQKTAQGQQDLKPWVPQVATSLLFAPLSVTGLFGSTVLYGA